MDLLMGLLAATLALLACLSVVVTASAGLNAAAQNASAYNVARQVIENLRLNKAAAVANGTYTDLSTFGSVPQLSQLDGGTGVVSVSTWRGSVKMAVVTVRWRGGTAGQSRSTTLTALLSARGVAP
jgi:hypothetical protein